MKYLIPFLLLPLLTSCNDPLCPAVTSVSTSFVTTISTQCGCDPASTAQLQSNVTKLLNVTGLCQSAGNAATGPIFSVVCPLAGQLLTGYVANQLPAGCANAKGCVGGVMSVAVAACSMIPLQPKPSP